MLALSDDIINELTKRNKYIIPVVEIYPRSVETLNSLSSPGQAIGRFSNVCYTWSNSTGSYEYDAKVLAWPEVKSYLDSEVNTAEIEFSNVARGEASMSRFCLDNKIKGCWMVIRFLYPDKPEESNIVFWGKCERPGGINNETITLIAKQDLGNYRQEIPFREYGIRCPLQFAQPLGGCLGDQALTAKSVSYRRAVEQYGSAGCNKLFSTCTLLENTKYFQGQRVVAVSGQFSYITIEEVVKRVLFWTKRKKISVVKTDSWSSVNQSEGSEVVPLAFGRCQIQGHPFTWADQGQTVKSLLGFCEGKISAFTFVRSRTQGINVISQTEHLGDWGSVGTQQLDTLFNGASGYNSRLAYLEIVTDGSSPTQVDDSPIITAVIRGMEVPVPDVNGNYTIEQWSNNPVHITRFLMTDPRFGRIPTYRIDDAYNLFTADDCDEIVEDRTNEEFIVLPANEVENYNLTYRRFRSAGRYTAYRDMWDRGLLPTESVRLLAPPPEFEDPEIRWFDPFQPYVLPPLRNVLRQKYTFNGALQEKTSLLDFLYERLFPTFKGYLNYSPDGLIQIKNRQKADNAYVRAETRSGALSIPVTNVRPWKNNLQGYLLIGVSLEDAEIREVVGFDYSTACNDFSITTEDTGGVTSTSADITGGSRSAPGMGYIELAGTPIAGDEVKVIFGEGDNEFTISYIADGVEDLQTFTRMLVAFLNANIQFAESFTAYTLVDNPYKILIRCESGYLIFNKPTEFKHYVGEEVLRVQAVFENCGELTANTSAQFDNIIENTFKWNEEKDEEVNAIIAKYTSAVDDFHLTNIMPRAGWDTIDLEGELLKDEIDLTFVDNYWQAAYLTKGQAIDRIDGNLHFSFDTGIIAIRLELGDVVAVRHDSGDGALNYVPCWITKNEIKIDDFTVSLGLKLYLSAAFDYNVQPVEPLLTTTLNAALYPEQPPTTTGSGGGTSRGTEPIVYRPDGRYYEKFRQLGVYSPTGVDIV